MRPEAHANGAAPSGAAHDLVARYTACWDRALAGGPAPSLEAHLGEVSEADRAGVRSRLEELDREYQGRVGLGPPPANDQTVDLADVATRAATVDTQPAPAVTFDSNANTLDAPGGPTAGLPPTAGYEILSELGRGGMGVVYKARQLGLNRLVALKMVLSGAHAAPHQLARFRVEGEAVARLHHPHIVQIYDVGERDGLPFFSLEYLDGGCLADQIKREPQPPKRAAGVSALLARGVQYAHAHGIVHRDLKPANILFDADGVPKITDFGLAKKLEEGADSHTVSGTVVGTPSYMAPEQARGDTRQIGPAADVYSLGAILYELLTGRPPHQGTTLLETLEQVRAEEPVPPRQLVPKVPRDLETICLKCLQKEPAKRYASAAELGDDLDRYLAGQPILARPVGGVERLTRWCRRNPRTAGLTAAVFLSLVGGTVVSTALAIGMGRERNQKEAERQRAEEAREAAEAAKREAQRNAEEVLRQSGLALGSFGTLIDEVQKQIGDSPNMQALKLKLLETALAGLDKVAKSDEHSRLLGQSMAAAYMQIGHVFRQAGQTDKAFAQYRKSHEIVQALADRDSDGPVAQANLAVTLSMIGELTQAHRRDLPAALRYYEQSLALRRALAARPPDDRLDMAKLRADLAESYTRVGVTYLRLGEPARAAGYLQDSVRLREELAAKDPANLPLQRDLARSHLALGELRFRLRDWPAARDHFVRALAASERVHQADPESPTGRLDLANALGNFGVFALRTGDLTEAGKHLPRGRELMAGLTGLDDKNADYRRYLALADYRCSTLARRTGDPAAAARWDAECLALRERLASDAKENERRAIELALARSRTGDHVVAAAAAAAIEKKPNLDRELLVELTKCYSQLAGRLPDGAEPRARYLARALDLLGRAAAKGFKDVVVLETEPDLDAVRAAPGFAAVLAAADGAK